MERAFTPMSIGATAVFLTAFIYAFGYPLAAWFALRYFSDEHYTYVQAFYRPVTAMAMRCPPYLAILRWESRMLGLGPPSHSASAGSP